MYIFSCKFPGLVDGLGLFSFCCEFPALVDCLGLFASCCKFPTLVDRLGLFVSRCKLLVLGDRLGLFTSCCIGMSDSSVEDSIWFDFFLLLFFFPFLLSLSDAVSLCLEGLDASRYVQKKNST